MELPKAKWLKIYSWCIIAVSAIETLWMAPGDLLEKMAFSALSCITVVIGLISSCVIIDSYVRWLKLTQTMIVRKHRQNIEDIVILFFYFGAIGSGILVLIYPFIGSNNVAFSMAPMGIGFLLGAKWISKRYDPPHYTTVNKVIHLNRKDHPIKNTYTDDGI